MSDAKDAQAAITRSRAEYAYTTAPFSQLCWAPETWAFRDDKELSDDALKDLAGDIRVCGLQDPITVRVEGDRKLVLDGHRRFGALKLLVRDHHLSEDSLIPVAVVQDEPDDMEQLLRIGSQNTKRNAWSDDGLIRYCKALADRGCPNTEIGRVIGKSEKQVGRYLRIAQCEWMMKMVREHVITTTNAVKVLEACKTRETERQQRRVLEEWRKEATKELELENRERRAKDKKVLSGKDLWLSKRMKAELVDAWKTACETGDWDITVGFKFYAGVEEEDGRKKIEIDSLKVNVDKLDLAAVTKIFKRCHNLATELEPILLEKKRAAELSPAAASGSTGSSAAARLSALGLAEFAAGLDEVVDDGELDEEFDEPGEYEEVDYTGSAELPEDQFPGPSPGASDDGTIDDSPVDGGGDETGADRS